MTSNATLDQIARRHLGIETLEVRNRDSLDFHDVGVAGLKSALQAAFAAGQGAVATDNVKAATAAGNYAAALDRVRANLERLTSAVDAHAQSAAGQPRNWGFAGDLAYVEARLHETLEFLGK